MEDEILTLRLSVRLKEYDSSYGKDVGHREQQNCDEHHRLRGAKSNHTKLVHTSIVTATVMHYPIN